MNFPPSRSLLLASLVLFGAASTAVAQAPASTDATAAPPPSAPPAVAPDPAPQPEPFGIDVGGFRLKLSAEVRTRGEARLSPYFGPFDPTWLFVTHRTRVGLDARRGCARLFIQVQDVRNWGDAPLGTDAGPTTGVHQGYLQLGDMGANRWLRVGRQEINYGRQRLIGALNWTSPARAFDAVRGHYATGDVELDVFAAYLRSQRILTTGLQESEGDALAGGQVAWAPSDAFNFEGTLLVRHDGGVEGAEARNRNISATSLRVHGRPSSLFYEAEAVLQLGRVGGSGHQAIAGAAEVGVVLGGPAGLRLSLGGDYASGAGGGLDEFDNFFPTNHIHYGLADLIGWRNMFDAFAQAKVSLTDPSLTGVFNARLLGLADPSARWSNAVGATIGQDATNDNRVLGAEFDLVATWKPLAGVSLEGGYTIFIPASAASRLGRGDVSHWMYLMVGVLL